ncbi:MAG TPA: uroporphyrinogen-III synthase [Beijerinckiaceae bacterium]|nr:uroporphyrinogen-III synthase [Beijerinckiaceae bacterium]
MRILVTRPKQAAERTAARLDALGQEVLIAPVLEITATGAVPPAKTFDGTLVTSAEAIARLDRATTSALRTLPMFVVGERTAKAAVAAGFADVRTVATDAQQLGETIISEFHDRTQWLYLAGRNRKPHLETALVASGCSVETIIVYEARPVASLPLLARKALREGRIDAVLHYSRRSATILRDLAAAAGLSEAARRPIHLCISEDTAAALREWAPRIASAEAPNEASMMAATTKLCAALGG